MVGKGYVIVEEPVIVQVGKVEMMFEDINTAMVFLQGEYNNLYKRMTNEEKEESTIYRFCLDGERDDKYGYFVRYVLYSVLRYKLSPSNRIAGYESDGGVNSCSVKVTKKEWKAFLKDMKERINRICDTKDKFYDSLVSVLDEAEALEIDKVKRFSKSVWYYDYEGNLKDSSKD